MKDLFGKIAKDVSAEAKQKEWNRKFKSIHKFNSCRTCLHAKIRDNIKSKQYFCSLWLDSNNLLGVKKVDHYRRGCQFWEARLK